MKKIKGEMMKELSLFFKNLKDKVGFRVMTENEYQEFLKKKGHLGVFDSDTEINPATGLLVSGGVDVCGNPYGIDLNNSTNNSFTEINPATGLPMSGGVDVCGNPHGIDLNNPTDNSFNYSNDTYNDDFHNT